MNENIILKKLSKKQKLQKQELYYIFNGYLNNQIDDLYMTEVLKLICKNELSDEETIDLTDIFLRSGDIITLPKNSTYVDKHSTGGVGDKTTLVVAPLVASCNVKIAKMSGRALGHTGGTIDKLESIGVNTSLKEDEFIKQTNEIGMAITGQTKTLCPMDKKVYALRDVTNTVSSISLIATSIMSKKIASGAEKILIDIKVGKGALIKTKKDAIKLAKIMIKIGKNYNREVVCFLTRMDTPLGNNIGNKLEVKEAIEILKNEKQDDFRKLCIEEASYLVSMGRNITYNEAFKEVNESLTSGKAYNKFLEFIEKQNGNLNLEMPQGKEISSPKTGYIKDINALIIGQTSMNLGAGRKQKEDEIDYNAGIVLIKKEQDFVKEGEVLCKIYGTKEINEEELLKAFTFTKRKPRKKDLLIKIIKG